MGFEPTTLGSTARRTKNLSAWCGVAYKVFGRILRVLIVRNVRNFSIDRQNMGVSSGGQKLGGDAFWRVASIDTGVAACSEAEPKAA
jgi:hypothetical protein